MAGLVEGRVGEQVTGAYQAAVVNLEAERHDPRWPVEACRVRMAEGHRHEGRVVGSAHAAADGEREAEGLQDLTDGGQPGLGPYDHHRVVLAYVLAGDE